MHELDEVLLHYGVKGMKWDDAKKKAEEELDQLKKLGQKHKLTPEQMRKVSALAKQLKEGGAKKAGKSVKKTTGKAVKGVNKKTGKQQAAVKKTKRKQTIADVKGDLKDTGKSVKKILNKPVKAFKKRQAADKKAKQEGFKNLKDKKEFEKEVKRRKLTPEQAAAGKAITLAMRNAKKGTPMEMGVLASAAKSNNEAEFGKAKQLKDEARIKKGVKEIRAKMGKDSKVKSAPKPKNKVKSEPTKKEKSFKSKPKVSVEGDRKLTSFTFDTSTPEGQKEFDKWFANEKKRMISNAKKDGSSLKINGKTIVKKDKSKIPAALRAQEKLKKKKK